MSDQEDGIHGEAIKLLRESSLSGRDKRDLYELYQEECEDTSVQTAMERLQSDIRDMTKAGG